MGGKGETKVFFFYNTFPFANNSYTTDYIWFTDRDTRNYFLTKFLITVLILIYFCRILIALEILFKTPEIQRAYPANLTLKYFALKRDLIEIIHWLFRWIIETAVFVYCHNQFWFHNFVNKLIKKKKLTTYLKFIKICFLNKHQHDVSII